MHFHFGKVSSRRLASEFSSFCLERQVTLECVTIGNCWTSLDLILCLNELSAHGQPSLIQSFHVGESELLSFGRQAIASAGLFSCGYKCLSVAIPYEQELGWRSDSRITSFFSHFFGAIPLWSSGVWCH